MENLSGALNRFLSEAPENKIRESSPQPKTSSPNTVLMILSLLRDLATIKTLNDLAKENSDRFFELHAKKLIENGYSVAAIESACDHFINYDERDDFNKTKFPQPDEFRKKCAEEQELIDWKREQAIKLKAERERMQNAPPALEAPPIPPHPWDDLPKDKVFAACILVCRGKSPEEARDEVMAQS